jgi:hypothetical protein
VVLMGSAFYVLEMNAAASHFPGVAFDAIESSLEIPKAARKLRGGITLETPMGWTFEADGARCSVVGPRFGLGPTVVQIAPGPIPAEMLAGAKPGEKVEFLGRRRETRVMEQKLEEDLVIRRLHVHSSGITALVTAPVSVWEDVRPTVEAILASVKAPG